MKCQHVKANGLPCQAAALRGDTWCWFHAPQLAAHRAEVRSRAGKVRQGRTVGPQPDEPQSWPIQTMRDIQALLEWAIADCLKLDRSVIRTNALASLIRAAVQINEQTELAERLTAVEAQIARIPEGKVGANGRGY
jgi:hypothetical protein